MQQNNDNGNLIDELIGTSLVQQAEIEVLQLMLEKLMKEQGVASIDGVSFSDWFQAEKIRCVERILINIEDQNPASAAYLQSIIDAAKGRRADQE